MAYSIPPIRIRTLNECPSRPDGKWVLYWMTAFRRPRSNFALDRAIHWSKKLGRPLLLLEAVRLDYEWASDRFHRFLIDGMLDNAQAFAKAPVTYYPFLETRKHPGKGLLLRLARDACVVVSDDFPCFFYPDMYGRLAKRMDQVRFELVDSNGWLPLRQTDRLFTVAHSYRRYLQKTFHSSLPDFPNPAPLTKLQLPSPVHLPKDVLEKWPVADVASLATRSKGLEAFAIDHGVPALSQQGGFREGMRRLNDFVTHRLLRYDEDRNEPSMNGTSGLSPYLHFGHLSTHEIVTSIFDVFEPALAERPVHGKATGFWGLPASVEGFLDQLLCWRELGFNQSSLDPHYFEFDSLPSWAITTLLEHASDRSPYLYQPETWENAETHDPLWNAAQRQLVREGTIHNYLRMLWGKKILHWSASPQEALQTMIYLNNKYALDGRDPNSYSGIFWVLGRYDRAWGPERPVFGKVRYMTSESTARKWNVKPYLERYA